MTLILSGVVGYLLGSLSGARIVGRRVAAGEDLRQTKVVLDGTGAAVARDGVSASSLQARSTSGGLRAGAIDILKALVPTLAAALVFPDGAEPVIVAAAALVGHVFPIYHRFVGGYGISPLLGGLVILDWRAPLITIALFLVVGFVIGSAYVAFEVWPIGLLAWFWWTGEPTLIAFAAVANALYWARSWTETVGALQAFRRDPRPWRARITDFSKYPDYEVPE